MDSLSQHLNLNIFVDITSIHPFLLRQSTIAAPHLKLIYRHKVSIVYTSANMHLFVCVCVLLYLVSEASLEWSYDHDDAEEEGSMYEDRPDGTESRSDITS